MSSRWHLDFDRESFLADYWQRKPLMIPAPNHTFIPPVSADELAGLALEADIESRLIEQSDDRWQLHHGPFTTEDFNRPAPWTLLVQAVDHAIDTVADLRKLIDFLPQWRIDDVMVSYATDGGSVGPHYDNYDVFLLQGEGKRRWRIGQRCDAHSPLLDHDELRILAQFEQSDEYLLHPGDILYVPPGVAHWGIAEGECTTFSIGFRAPRVIDLLSKYVDHALDLLDEDRFYTDAGRALPERAGEITQADVDRAQHALLQVVQTSMQDNWFGELVTEPGEVLADTGSVDVQALLDLALEQGHLDLAPESKVAWKERGSGITVYANGDSAQFRRAALPILLPLCEYWCLTGLELAQALTGESSNEMLRWLAEQGCLYVRE